MKPTQDTTALESEALVLQAADEFTESAQRGEQPSVQEYVQRYPSIADTIRRVFPALAALHETPTPALASFDFLEEPLGDFQVIEEIGRGGMGIVYRAKEIPLNRTVALKVLPIAGMLNEQTLSRFKNEARAAASLLHPHIVPVYSVGEERGVHYYVMRLIHGKSMAELIDEMRRNVGIPLDNDTKPIVVGQQVDTVSDDNARSDPVVPHTSLDTYGSPAFFRKVATWGAEAAGALAHAHSHGVLHRDIKPANLMIDTRGHLWVTDFGLARLDGDVGISVSGDLMGTFRYMSPEQALGRRILIDRRSDVYSLAVTLYELLTLRPVFTSENTLELLRQIAFEDPVAPRKLNRSIPVELETILMKGMEKDPKRRYADAEEFADDLQRFLDHRPVLAKPPTLVELATKWSLRHQAAVWASVAFIVLTIVTLTISTFVIARAYTVAHQNRMRAETNLRLAREVIDANYSKQIEALKHEPGMTQEQRRSILRLVQFYENLPQEDLADPLLRHDACKARLNLADIYLVLGQPRKAIHTYGEVVEQAQELLDQQPTDADVQHTLAMAHDGRGQALYAIQDFSKSIDAHRQSLKLAQQLRQQHPSDINFQRLAVCQVHLARAYRESELKERTLRTAISTLNTLTGSFPNETLFESYLAGAQDELAQLLRATGRYRKAESRLRKAIDVHVRLADQHPQLPSHRYQLARTKRHLALLLSDLRRSDDAETVHREAVTLLKALAKEYPHRVLFRSELAKAHHELGTLLTFDRRHSDAGESYRAAVLLLEQLTVDAPEAPEYRADLASNHKDLAVVLMRLGDGKTARQLLNSATEIWRKLCNEFPNNPDYEKNLAIVGTYSSQFEGIDNRLESYRQTVDVLASLAERYPERIEYQQLMIQFVSGLGGQLKAIGKLEEAEGHFLRAIRIADAFSKTTPELPLYHEVAGQSAAFGDVSRQLGKYEQSANAYQTAVQNYRLLRESFPDKPEYRAGLSSNLKRLGYAYSQADRFEEALKSYNESIQLAHELSKDYPNEPEFVGKLARRYQLLGILHLEAGNVAEAEQAFRHQSQSRLKLTSQFREYRIGGIPNAQLMAMLANIVVHQDPSRWPEAEMYLNRAIEHSVASGELMTGLRLQLLLADIYRTHGLSEKASQTVAKAIDQLGEIESTRGDKKDPTFELSLHSTRWLIAVALSRNGDKEKAEEFRRIVMEQELRDATWKSVQAWYIANWPETDEELLQFAVKLATEATEANPDNSLYWSMLGIAQYRHGVYTDSAKSLAKSLDLSNNENVFSQLYLALAEAQLGEVQTAVESAAQIESRLLLGDPLHISSFRQLLDEFNELVAGSDPQ